VLVLTRHANQSIMIGHDVVVTVLEVRGDQVRLGIRAPREVTVHREEVFIALQKANQAAASPTADALDALTDIRPAVLGAKAPSPDAAAASSDQPTAEPPPPAEPARA
jgi:carbon storage regulator